MFIVAMFVVILGVGADLHCIICLFYVAFLVLLLFLSVDDSTLPSSLSFFVAAGCYVPPARLSFRLVGFV